ncbi:probable receptor-like protein kinase At5g20050 [Cynara cardunculus var. scolymus]|uniref:probable receptor-like protein kinase At5g20050 n=1 Tax=Cynara cardunculus var. scolymus TaxID=59895 RepID=UPI000D62BE24|nr:probable receptor-like protein kinase At5g20050 [Cynara cardunculus var. scolymus]
MEDRNANIISVASIIILIIVIIISRILLALTEPFFLILGASIAAILAIIVFYFTRRRFNSRKRKMETIIASEGAELRIEYSFLRKVAGLPTKFRFKELEEATDNWKLLIGAGASGSVFRGKLKDGTAVAVKRIQHGEERGGKEFRSEIAAIASVQHVNLVRLFGYCSHSNNTHFLVYDFIPNGCLSNWIFNRPSSAVNANCTGGCLSWQQRSRVAIDVAKALAYLHHDCRSKVLHLDVKPENILLNENYHAIVSDFGISKLMKPDDSRIVTSLRGTKGYIAPEWLLGLGISEKSDVFSYGIVLLEIIGGRRSVKAIDVNDGDQSRKKFEYFPKIVKEKLRSGRIMDVVDPRLLNLGGIDENEVTKMVHVALWCIQHKSRRRPSMVDVVKWLEGRVAVVEPPETSMMVVDLLSIENEGHGAGDNGGWQNRNKRRKLGVVARVASQINGCLVPNSTSTARSNSFTYSMSIISPR